MKINHKPWDLEKEKDINPHKMAQDRATDQSNTKTS